jgi:galactonate dehydratase
MNRPRLAQQTTPITRRQMLEASLAVSAGLGLHGFSTRVGHAAPSKKWLTIEDIKRTTVKLSYRETSGRNMARELPHWAWTEVTEVTLKSGHVGVGETLLYYTWGATEDDDVARARGKNAVAIMWDDTLGAGLQMALFDAVAKSADVPVHALLATKQHETTPVGWWNIDTSAADMASECQEAYRQGYRGYKTKGRPWYDVWKQIEEVAKVVPDDFHFAMDFNDTLLDAERGIPILKELEAIAPKHLIWETPIFQKDVPGNQAIRKTCRGKVAMHYGTPDPLVAIREDVCDGFVVGHGATELMESGHVAEMGEKSFWLQLVGTGITASWSLQFGGVLRNAIWPAVNCHQLYQHSLLVEPIQVVEGMAKVPDRPGLGIELDRDAIARFRVDKPKSRPDPPRLIETRWPDGRTMYLANTEVNFVLNAAREGITPYFERGVDTRLVPNDGSTAWRERYERARKAPFIIKQ